jgi:nucleoside-triphosphatase
MIILITGDSGTGKTTLCARLAATLRARGVDVAGVLTLPRYANGEKVGMDVADARTGARISLAERATRGTGTADLRWKFDEIALARGAQILRAATPCDVLIVDELGPLELIHGKGWTVALEVLQTQHYRDALVVVRPHLVDEFRARVNLPVQVVTLTLENREQVWSQLVEQLIVRQ